MEEQSIVALLSLQARYQQLIHCTCGLTASMIVIAAFKWLYKPSGRVYKYVRSWNSRLQVFLYETLATTRERMNTLF
ncbi:hypothetical protein BDR03DRAFT_939756 [Suillus americanus]|nr:hypothetical protein BDR03DRAFT_939756 [Suillus americanus]